MTHMFQRLCQVFGCDYCGSEEEEVAAATPPPEVGWKESTKDPPESPSTARFPRCPNSWAEDLDQNSAEPGSQLWQVEKMGVPANASRTTVASSTSV
eukprot:CAMPEP_0198201812 /NCGR_PEP_ID=MMETSP1445-20131203/4833_1 /TAXON_ID=36898 /ORGANISM="Pyramimonas sp., Strain CCMP2087" /LENGTH=96 /DNA_ID=CAMNT_0043872431 /DNA_START=197 /DNA_END=487 /DNA_ORIENTATION=-